MYVGSRPTSKLRTGRNPAAGWRAAASSAGASDTDSWSREYKVIRGTIQSWRSRGGGGSKEPIVTRDGLGKTRTDVVGGGGWFAGRGKSRRRGGMGKQAGDAGKSMLACFDRVQGRRRGQEQRKAEFRARGVGGGLVKGGGRRTTKSHQSTSRPVKDAGCPPIDAASALNILRKLGVLARK